jgi:hypothetical protein
MLNLNMRSESLGKKLAGIKFGITSETTKQSAFSRRDMDDAAAINPPGSMG